jgi:hypothetical protein
MIVPAKSLADHVMLRLVEDGRFAGAAEEA